MTAIFAIDNPNGNATVFYDITKEEIEELVRQYQNGGWKVTLSLVNSTNTRVLYVIR